MHIQFFSRDLAPGPGPRYLNPDPRPTANNRALLVCPYVLGAVVYRSSTEISQPGPAEHYYQRSVHNYILSAQEVLTHSIW